MSETTIRIALVDDHQLMLDGLSRLLKEIPEVEVLATFSDPLQARRSIPSLNPDLVFMDLDMPGLHGSELAQQLLQEMPDLKVVVVTMHVDAELIKQIVKLNVAGYLLKSDDEADFKQAVMAVAQGKQFFSPAVTQALVSKPRTMERSLPTKTLALTEREREILIKIAEGLSTKEIGELLFISPRTVETHRKALMKKLDVANMAGLVRIAVKEGLV